MECIDTFPFKESPADGTTLAQLCCRAVAKNFSKYNCGELVAGKHVQGSHGLEKYLNIQDCLEKFLKIKFALKST